MPISWCPAFRMMGTDARKRLEALQEVSELGSGLKLAMHDLEIRGAGTLLGDAQSGHIAAVGFDMYLQILEQAVRELKGEEMKEEIEPEIDLPIPGFSPGGLHRRYQPAPGLLPAALFGQVRGGGGRNRRRAPGPVSAPFPRRSRICSR